jgi:hypothetical protein
MFSLLMCGFLTVFLAMAVLTLLSICGRFKLAEPVRAKPLQFLVVEVAGCVVVLAFVALHEKWLEKLPTADGITAFATVVQAVVVCVTLVFIYRQLKDAKQSYQLGMYNAVSNSLLEVNKFVLSSDHLRKLNAESDEEVLGHVHFNHFDQIYTLYQNGYLDAQSWEAEKAFMTHYAGTELAKSVWPDAKRFFRRDFVDFFDRLRGDKKGDGEK